MGRRLQSAPRRLWLVPQPSSRRDLAPTPGLVTPGRPLGESFLAEASPRPGSAVSLSSFSKWGDEGARLRTRHKFGKWLMFLISASFVLLTAAIGFLSWLWFGDRESEQWRQLVTGPYNARSITLSGVLVRYSVGTLAWITTAMLASTIVEMHGVSRHRIAEASMARYTGAIIPLVFRPFALKASLVGILLPIQFVCGIASQFTSSFLLSDVDSGLVRGFGQQQVSMFDFQPKSVTDEDGKQSLDVDSTNLPLPNLGWELSPTTSEIFAEYAEPENRTVHPLVDDTGPTWRALFPIDSAAVRSSMTEYKGVAKMFDARVVCTYPNIETLNITKVFPDEGDADSSLIPVAMYRGTGKYNIGPVPGIPNFGNDTVDFFFECPVIHTDCNLISVNQAGEECPAQQPVFGRCLVRPIDTTDLLADDKRLLSRLSSLDPSFYHIEDLPAAEAAYDRDPGPFFRDPEFALELEDEVNKDLNAPGRRIRRRMGNTFLLLDMAEPLGSHPLLRSVDTDVVGVSVPMVLENEPANSAWQVLRSTTPMPPEMIRAANISEDLLSFYQGPIKINTRASMCFDTTMTTTESKQYYDIEAVSETTHTEPRQNWIQDDSQFNITSVIRQLGATSENLTYAERGIFALSRDSVYGPIEREIRPVGFPAMFLQDRETLYADFASQALGGSVDKRGVVLCARQCVNFPSDLSSLSYLLPTDPYWGQLFNRVVRETDSPARALQALNTAKARMGYMGWLSAYTQPNEGTVTTVVPAQVPARKAGFAAVAAVIGTQVLLFAYALVRFAGTRNTILDNAWLVVSQVSSSVETADILAHPGTVTDEQVAKYLAAVDGRETHRGGAAAENGLGYHQGPGPGRAPKFVALDGTFRRKIEPESLRRRAAWSRDHLRGNSPT